ncbi:hypothetical protein NEOLEDRAFT_1244724 [Neolentinus lepideus HHB14362 ss-1]|uniref:Uncharacterized protein n=1 Tax=Neolentinus lepideus HHB14362 ss-1 TaxID=1314782 RepID=A0A165PKB7_9AGAM|nr:hypothetical protein NEOLEDRAFT_1244724 [Neolentinus lepideus HHB14362 ss-1]
MEFPTYPASVATSTVGDSNSPLLRKGSLHASFRAISCPESDEQSAFYLTLQSPRETKDEFSSFLYLDLADSSSSLRRKPSSVRKPDLRTSFLMVASPDAEDFTPDLRTPSPDFTGLLSATLRFADTDSPYATPMPSPTTSLRRRSRDRLPTPKPAPSSHLPPVPQPSSSRHLTPLDVSTPPTSEPPSPSVPSHSHSHSHSAPSIMSPSSACFLSGARTSFLPSFRAPRRSRTRDESTAAQKRNSKASSTLTRGSSVTSHQRRANRSTALACLEGRSPNPYRISRDKTNFMSLSDDEDDAEADDEKDEEDEEECMADFVQVQEKETSERDSIHLHDAMLIDDEDVVMPFSPSCTGRLRSHSRVSPPPRPSKSRSRSNTLRLNITVPNTNTPVVTSPVSSKPPVKNRRSRSTTLESWFPPLANFIDLADDEVGRWRSFVEVGSP